jgi:hypothetical protein
MDLVKALLVFLMLTGCAEVAEELPLVRGAIAPESAHAGASDANAARLGPPSPGRANARHVDAVATSVN